jgi:hypothetical protein
VLLLGKVEVKTCVVVASVVDGSCVTMTVVGLVGEAVAVRTCVAVSRVVDVPVPITIGTIVPVELDPSEVLPE